MRVDELYNVGGHDPDHPSGNVLDAFEHSDPACIPGEDRRCICKHVTVRHHDRRGKKITDRKLSTDEQRFFFPNLLVEDPPSFAEQDAVKALGRASVAERIDR